ncbi:MAG TPA: glycoside hydrolase family 3 N-terminal domain-containing protein [Ktedonobacteraceae bacterium]|nr:glycoside hydrolase family 3 N-terminal domain-containing protein [Ktedonobacteraceae bacterium]
MECKDKSWRWPARRTIHILLHCCLLLIVSGCVSLGTGVSGPAAQPDPTSFSVSPTATPVPLNTDSQIASALLQRMSLDQKLGQMVISEFNGSTLNADLTKMVRDYYISGVLIENKNGNAQNRTQLVNLNKAMQGQATFPLLITTDFEGGFVNELRQITGERSSEATIGATGDPQVAYDAGKRDASDLKKLGLNVNFMPIVDVLTNPNNPGLIDRTYGNNPALVTDMGRAYLKGLTSGGIVGSLKHFPGLGSASVDPHKSLPYMDRSLATMNAVDLVPYRTLIKEGIVPMVMVTHILNPQLDPKMPTSLSPEVVTDLLRQQLGFKGVIISDTLWMGGVSNTYDLSHAAVLAINAGTNLILGPRGLSETATLLSNLKKAVDDGTLALAKIDASVQLILEMKLHYKILSRDKAVQFIQNNQPVTPTGNA